MCRYHTYIMAFTGFRLGGEAWHFIVLPLKAGLEGFVSLKHEQTFYSSFIKGWREHIHKGRLGKTLCVLFRRYEHRLVFMTTMTSIFGARAGDVARATRFAGCGWGGTRSTGQKSDEVYP